ncbi:MAG: flagellar assembly peptidoglycan hydrolase FlgJ [Lautropia sp.]|nr:flagellar assembly peptidoglycan hydrolase FlgJ [Lautropia sp.]
MVSVDDSSLIARRADPVTDGLAFDGHALDSLRHRSSQDRQAIREVARQFEALFMRQLLKEMRNTIPRSGLFEGDGSDTFMSMLDSQLSGLAAGQTGGLSEMIERQLTGGSQAGIDMHQAGQAAGGGMPASVVVGHVPGHVSAARDGIGAAAGSDEMAQPRDEHSATLGPVQEAFVKRMWPHALQAQRVTGLPAAWVVGQAALESGWGQRDIRDEAGLPSHNLFGIKAGKGWKGKTVAAVTTEYVDGVARKSVELFRRYGSYVEAFADWGNLLANNPRFRQALNAADAGAFAEGLEKGGYATDPSYGRKLKQTISNLVLAVAGWTK